MGKTTSPKGKPIVAIKTSKSGDLENLKSLVLQEVLQRLPLKTILQNLTLRVEQLIPDTKCSVLLIGKNGKTFKNGGTGSLSKNYFEALEGIEVCDNFGSCGTAAARNKCIISSSIKSDTRWPEPFKSLALQHNLQACWSVPVTDGTGTVVATFGLYHSHSAAPQAEELEKVRSLANIIALAIDQNRMLEKEKYLQSLQQCMVELAGSYINIEGYPLDKALQNGITKITRAAKADRGHILLFNADGQSIHNTYEYCAPGISSLQSVLQNITVGKARSWFAPYRRNNVIHLPDVKVVPQEPFRDTLMQMDINSLVAVPLRKQGSLVGFVGFTTSQVQRSFHREEINLLFVLSEILVNLKTRYAVYQKAEQNRFLLEKSQETAQIGSWELDVSNFELWTTNFVRQILDLPENTPLTLPKVWRFMAVNNQRNQLISLFSKSIEQQTEFTEEYKIRTTKGEEKWILLQGKPVAKDKKVICIRGIAQNITEQRRESIINNLQHNLNEAILYSKDLEHLVEILKNELDTLLEESHLALALYKPKTDEFYIPYPLGKCAFQKSWKARNSLSDRCLQKGQALHLFNNDLKELEEHGLMNSTENNCREWLGLPIYSKAKPLGVIVIKHYKIQSPLHSDVVKALAMAARQIGIFIDKQRNEELLQLQSTAIKQLPISIMLASTSGEISYVNPAFTRQTGYTLKESQNKKLFFHHKLKQKNKLPKEVIQQVLNGETWRGELQAYSKSGATFYEEIMVAPILSKGKIIRIISINKDVSNERKLSKQLQDNLEQIQVINDNTPNITWKIELTPEGKYVNSYISKSAEEFLHLPQGTIGGDVFKLFSYVDEEYQKLALSRLDQLLKNTGTFGTVSYKVNKGEGSTAWFQTTARSAINEKNIVVYGSTIDISSLKQQEEALIHSKNNLKQLLNQTTVQNKRLRDYAFIVSHNIRNSVANIMGLNDLLQEEPTNDEYLEMMQSSVSNLDSTIRSLNELIAFENTLENKEKTDCNIHEAVQRVLKLRQYTIRERQAQVSVKIPKDLTVKAIPAFFESIFDNLIGNALKYGVNDDQKDLDIYAHKTEQGIEIGVQDYGIGIDMEKNGAKLFEPGSRFHSLSIDGKGLGLFLIKNQIEALNGEIKVISKPGEGALFKVYFY